MSPQSLQRIDSPTLKKNYKTRQGLFVYSCNTLYQQCKEGVNECKRLRQITNTYRHKVHCKWLYDIRRHTGPLFI